MNRDLLNMKFGINNVTKYRGDDSHIYLNIDLPDKHNLINATANSSLAKINITKSSPILENPSFWHLSIMKFKLSGWYIPLYIWGTVTPKQIRISYNGEVQTVDLVYTPYGPTDPTSTEYYFIYEYQHYLDILNKALSDAFNALTVKPPTVGDAPEAPFMTWDSLGQRFTLHAQKNYYDLSLATPIEIFFGESVYLQFPAFAYNSSDPDFWQLLVKDYHNNTETINSIANDYLYLIQQFSGVDVWNPVQGLAFLSSSLSVKQTYSTVNVNNANSSNNATIPLLVDFFVNVDNSGDCRKTLIYNPTAEYKLLDMLGTEPLSTIDLSVYFIDLANNLRPLRVSKNTKVSIQLLFRKKPTLTSV